MLDGKADQTLTIVHALASEGYDIAQVCRDLLRHLRNLVVARVAGAGAKALLDLPDDELADLQACAGRHDPDDLTRCYQGFSRAFDEIVRSPSARAALEMALIRLARRPPLLPLDDLLQRLADLERRLGGGPSRGPARGPSPSSVAHIRKDHEPSATAPTPRLSIVEEPPFRGGFEGALATSGEPHLERPVLRAVEPPKPPPAPRVRPTGDDAWSAVVDAMRARTPALAATYEHAKYVSDEGDEFVIAFAPGDFLAERGMQPAAVRELEEVARAVLGPATVVRLRLEEHGGESLAHRGERERVEQAERARSAVLDNPGVRALIERFGATVRDVKPAH
jgi:DNA polymerase-3 subunit gamma/tau